MKLNDIVAKADELLTQYNHAVRRVKDEKRELAKAIEHAEAVLTAQHVVQQVAQTVQEQAHDQIANVVSRCLAAVFDDPYEFRVVFERKRGKTEARLVFVREGHEVDPMTAAGGGAVDVAAFALRLACLLLSRPVKRRLIVVDEPFKNVHGDEYRERLRQLLHVLAVEMDVQFIMSTGINDFHTGKIIEL